MQRVIVYYAFKIMDGIFVGNSRAPQEREFQQMNKINSLINCAASELCYTGQGNILTFDWKDADDQIIVTEANIAKISEFIDVAIENCEGVLFFSVRGQSRALTALTAYLMYKLQWSLFKTLQFLNSRRRDFEIRAAFLKQLVNFEAQYFKDRPMSRDWSNQNDISDEIVIQNTYLNSMQQTIQPLALQASLQYTYGSKQTVTWAATIEQQIENIDPKEPKQMQNCKIKSILKFSMSHQKKRMIKRPISVCENGSANFEDFLIQNLVAPKKFQTPTLNQLNFDYRAKPRDNITPIKMNNQKVKLKRSLNATPDRQRIIQNTKQILETYLNSYNLQPNRGRASQTPQKERIRAASQQTPSPNRMSFQQKQLIIDNQYIMKLSQTKKLPQFKLK